MRKRWAAAVGAWTLIGLTIGLLALPQMYPDVLQTLVSVVTGESTQSTLTTGEHVAVGQDVGSDGTDGPDETELTTVDEMAFVSTEDPVDGSGNEGGLAAQWILNDGDDLPLIGYHGDADFSLTLPTGWEATDGLLVGRVAASTRARDDTSVRIDVDGRPIGSWSADQPEELRLPVPFDRIEQPDVPVEFVTTTPLADDPICLDPGHVARWLEMEDLSVSATVRPAKLDITRAVRGLGTVSEISGEPIHVVVDGRPTPSTLEVLGNLAAAVGHYGLPSDWHVSFDRQMPVSSGAQIWIKEDPETPARVSVRVVDNRPVLEIAGQAIGMKHLSEALSDPDRIDYFHYTRVSAEDVPRGSEYPIREVFRFEDDGYDDRTLRGSGHQSLIYRIHIPAGVPPDAATLALYATHSPSLADAESTISVRINGSPEEIVAVASESGQLDALHTVAPAELRPGLNYVKITTQLVGPARNVGGCGGESSSAWFTVSNGSGLGVERPAELQRVRLGVEDARFALAAPVDFNGSDVAIPDGVSPDDVELAVDVIGRLSHRAQGGSPRLVADQDVKQERHIVVVGADLGRQLLSSVPKITRADLSVNETTIAAQVLGMAAAQPSPFLDGKVLLAFTGPSQDGARRAVEAAMSAEVNDITSNFALVSPDVVRSVGVEEIRFDDLIDQQGAPTDLAFADDGTGIPDGEEYDQWVLDQARRIEATQQSDEDRRRVIALSLLVGASVVAGLWWVQRTRRQDQAGGR